MKYGGVGLILRVADADTRVIKGISSVSRRVCSLPTAMDYVGKMVKVITFEGSPPRWPRISTLC